MKVKRVNYRDEFAACHVDAKGRRWYPYHDHATNDTFWLPAGPGTERVR